MNTRQSPSRGKQSSRWVPAIAAVGVLCIVVAVGALGGGNDDSRLAHSAQSPASIPDSAGLTVPISTLPGVVIGSAPASVVKTDLTRSLVMGLVGPDVTQLQVRLSELGFAPGAADGGFGDQTRQAVWAFEKLVMKTPRALSTGKVTNDMWQLMQDPIVVHARRTDDITEPAKTHMEIYLPEQVAIVFTANKATLIIHIASGTDQPWCEPVTKDTDEKGNPIYPAVQEGECGVSHTPGGVFKFKRSVAGEHMGPLGGMWNPVYFNYGIAVHGAINVPLEPASHGCIRMHKRISETFQNFVHIGDGVFVWGQDGKEPEAYTKKEMLPVFNHKDPNATTTTSTVTTTAPPSSVVVATTLSKLVATTTTASPATTATTAVAAATTTGLSPPTP